MPLERQSNFEWFELPFHIFFSPLMRPVLIFIARPSSADIGSGIDCGKSLLSQSEVGDFTRLQMAYDLCYKAEYDRLLLGDFELRRSIFGDQIYLNRVLLWMVVAITVSGVLLAALQLILSYRLTVMGRNAELGSGDLSIEKDKVSLKSSVIGLLILVVSLAFFTIYVYGVYTLKESPSSVPEARATSSEGGLGIFPSAGKN